MSHNMGVMLKGGVCQYGQEEEMGKEEPSSTST